MFNNMPEKSQYLCNRIQLNDPDPRGFEVMIKHKLTDIFIVRKGDEVYAYENICPHGQASLE